MFLKRVYDSWGKIYFQENDYI
ncbi:protein of unknown function [Candidatus Nitrotoga arctica]|uniref:Uncharacterized protein n=1 Tax=Candidatus Nitrotoga arctica TaxID=453162 RepID=A0ABN8ATP0_9PROT|nr:protein of unknown function [Candidatus Nitrotoga arctica]